MPNRERRQQRLRSIYEMARKLVDPEQQAAYLDAVCGTDHHLRSQAERLLESDAFSKDSPLDQAMERISGMAEELLQQDGSEDCHSSQASELDLQGIHDGPQLDAYRIVERVGEGGMGIVYRAVEAAPLVREVAIKVIKPGMQSPQILSRFRTEQASLGLMEHPHIARIFASGTTSLGLPYFAMELVRGVSLTQYCQQHQLTLNGRLELFCQACEAVEHAHQRGFIHRDLKPSNLLTTQLDGQPAVKVIDFGVAKALDEDGHKTAFTEFGQLIGSPLYMSPEQVAFDSRAIDTRCDVYALGAILYELLCGVPPFERQRLKQAGYDGMRRIISTEIALTPRVQAKRQAAAGRACPPIPRTLDWIVMRALAKEPSGRYRSAAALRDDLRRFLANQPVSVAPPLLGYRLTAYVVRHTRSLAAAACLFIAGMLLASWFFFQSLPPPKPPSAVDNAPLIAAIEIRQSRLQDQQEAIGLQQLLTALNRQNLSEMAAVALPRDSQGNLLGSQTIVGATQFRQALLDAARPQPLRTFFHPAAVNDISWRAADDPAQPGWLASACADGRARLWNLDSGELLHEFPAHRFPIESVAISPDGQTLAVGDQDGVIELWDLGDLSAATPSFQSAPHLAGIQTLRWSPDGSMLAAGVRFEYVELISPRGEPLLRISTDRKGARHESLLFSADSRRLITVGETNLLEVWDAIDGVRVDALEPRTLAGNVRAFNFLDADESALLLGDTESQFLVALNLDTRVQRQIETGFLYPGAFAVDKATSKLAIAYPAGKLLLLQLGGQAKASDQVGSEPGLVLDAHDPAQGKVTSVGWTAPQELITAGEDGLIKIWDIRKVYPWREQQFADGLYLRKWNEQQFVLVRHPPLASQSQSDVCLELTDYAPATSRAVVRSPSDSRIVPIPGMKLSDMAIPQVAPRKNLLAFDRGERLELYRLPSLVRHQAFDLTGHDIINMSFSSSGNKLAVATSQDECILFTALPSTDEYQRQASWSAKSYHVSPQFSPDEKTLFQYDIERQSGLRLIVERDLATGIAKRTFPASDLRDFCLSPSGRLLAIAARGGLQIYDLQEERNVLSNHASAPPQRLVFLDGDRILVCNHQGSTLRCWHVPTATYIGELFNTERWPERVSRCDLPFATDGLLGVRHPLVIEDGVLLLRTLECLAR